MKSRLLMFVLGALFVFAGAVGRAADISGTRVRLVDSGNGLNPNGTLVFKQEGEKLAGTLISRSGDEQRLTGTVKGNRLEFSFEVTVEGQPVKITYTGTIESITRISGTFKGARAEPFKWTATRKE